ncbi:MAG: polymorphic toxin-type HINT domain-containing protein [Chloroflexota bacterium]
MTSSTVSTPDGDVPIAEIEVGDTVYAYNELTGEVGEYEVTAVISHEDPEIAYLVIDGEMIVTTPGHPFYTSDGEWVEVQDLELGDLIMNLDLEYGTVDSIEIVPQVQVMYDLTVDEVHNFAVGDGAWVVHNACPITYPKTTAEPATFGHTPNGGTYGRLRTRTRTVNHQTVNGVEINGNFYPEDIPLPRGSSRNFGELTYNSVDEAWNQARIRMNQMGGPQEVVQVADGKWRSIDGRYQIRAVQADIGSNVARPHVHLEILNPETGQIISNGHFYFNP